MTFWEKIFSAKHSKKEITEIENNFFYHCSYGDVDKVKEIIKKNARLINIDVSNSHGQTALHRSIIKGCTEIVEILLNCGANVNSKDKESKTPLMLAAQFNWIEITEMLLKKGANVNDKDKNGWTPLIEASYRASSKILEMLLKSGAKIDDISSETIATSALHQAAVSNSCENIKVLLAHGANINEIVHDGTPLMHAAYEGRDEMVSFLLKEGADLNFKDHFGNTVFDIGTRNQNDDKKIMDILLEYKDCEKQKKEHLWEGCKCKCCGKTRDEQHSWDGCKCLVCGKVRNEQHSWKKDDCSICEKCGKVRGDWGGKQCPDCFYESIEHKLIDSIKQKNILEIKKYIHEGADINAIYDEKEGVTPLHIACTMEFVEAVKLLIQHHANLNIQDYRDETPLYKAAEKNNVEIVTLLLESGAEVNTKDYYGKPKTPLERSICHGISSQTIFIVELLLKYGASVDTPFHGETLLQKYLSWIFESRKYQTSMSYESSNYVKFVELLIKYGAVLNPNDGSELLVIAAKFNNLDLIELLLEKGYDIESKSFNTRTALMEAVYYANIKTTEFLLNHGANPNIADDKGRTALWFATFGNRVEFERIGEANYREKYQNDIERVAEILLNHGADALVKVYEYKPLDYWMEGRSINSKMIQLFYRNNRDSLSSGQLKGTEVLNLEYAKILITNGDLNGIETIFKKVHHALIDFHFLSDCEEFNRIVNNYFQLYNDCHQHKRHLIHAKEGDDWSMAEYSATCEPAIIALDRFENITSPVSNNILHILSQMEDGHAITYEGMDGGRSGSKVDFNPVRIKAKQILKARGNPVYNPDIFLDKNAWKY